jgi:hypothetical protein
MQKYKVSSTLHTKTTRNTTQCVAEAAQQIEVEVLSPETVPSAA